MPETHIASGKVREIYAIDDERLLLVASDRISTFDVVLPTEIPDKGRVLTGLSGYWFTLLAPIVPNHMLAIRDDGRTIDMCSLPRRQLRNTSPNRSSPQTSSLPRRQLRKNKFFRS